MAFMNDLYLSRKTMAAFAVIGLAWASYFAQMPVIKANLGVSDATARPIDSVIKAKPGPDVAVNEGVPPNEAPSNWLTEANSSSA